MICRLSSTDFDSILSVVNDAAEAYKGAIPEDRWKEPYMPIEELRREIEGGVEFYGWTENNALVAVMGIQPVNNITLIRHAYVVPSRQRKGIGKNKNSPNPRDSSRNLGSSPLGNKLLRKARVQTGAKRRKEQAPQKILEHP